eukprot:1106611-Pleurochrysis_carterae.AAC.1
MPLDKGVALCKEALERLRRAAKLRRTRRGGPRLDIGAIVREVIDVDLPKAREAGGLLLQSPSWRGGRASRRGPTMPLDKG